MCGDDRFQLELIPVTGSRNTRCYTPMLCQDLSSHAFRKCHAMYLTKFGIWKFPKVKELRVQASVKVKIDHKRQQNTIFFWVQECSKTFSLFGQFERFSLSYVPRIINMPAPYSPALLWIPFGKKTCRNLITLQVSLFWQIRSQSSNVSQGRSSDAAGRSLHFNGFSAVLEFNL